MSSIKKAKHAVYDTKYHPIWIPKYKKRIFNKEITEYIKKVFRISLRYYYVEVHVLGLVARNLSLCVCVSPICSPEESLIW